MSYICNGAEPSELDRLKAQVNAIQKRIDELSAPYSIANLCKKKPLSLPGFENGDVRKDATFYRKIIDQDVWKHFLSLGKMIHSQNGTFVVRGARSPYAPYYADEKDKYVPSRVSQLTREQAVISAEMIDKMVEIYNEYMVKLHPTVTVIDVDGVRQTVAVKPPEDIEE